MYKSLKFSKLISLGISIWNYSFAELFNYRYYLFLTKKEILFEHMHYAKGSFGVELNLTYILAMVTLNFM